MIAITIPRRELGIYAINLIKKHGQEKVDDLILRANQHKGYKVEDLEKIIEKYG